MYLPTSHGNGESTDIRDPYSHTHTHTLGPQPNSPTVIRRSVVRRGWLDQMAKVGCAGHTNPTESRAHPSNSHRRRHVLQTRPERATGRHIAQTLRTWHEGDQEGPHPTQPPFPGVAMDRGRRSPLGTSQCSPDDGVPRRCLVLSASLRHPGDDHEAGGEVRAGSVLGPFIAEGPAGTRPPYGPRGRSRGSQCGTSPAAMRPACPACLAMPPWLHAGPYVQSGPLPHALVEGREAWSSHWSFRSRGGTGEPQTLGIRSRLPLPRRKKQ